MAEQDNAQKTERPTPKRLEQARKRGEVASSQDVKSWGLLAGGLLALMLLAPIVAALVLAAVAANFVQSGLVWAPQRIAPQLSRISPASGAKRLFSTRAVVEFAKGLLKLAAVATICAAIARLLFADIAVLPALPVAALLERVDKVAIWLPAGALAALTLIAGLDFAYQRFAFLKQMRMTRQEVRDEIKQAEGDPHIKSRIRRLRAERARHRMMAAVPNAAVVITNPTHYAIALAYDMGTMAAPKVVAKGVDSLARRIRDLAEANEVPVVENPPLARALYAAVDLEEEIPVEHYQAVAKVIGYVMRLRDRRA
ncbi:MAG: flagellar biosynthesis protein FlhB [Rhodospirillales bacterium]|nr:flagellar biosynthesis protein FlhB [Rhodospirillales bacterium]